MSQGQLCLVLHAHLPYVRHPEYDSFFEENWLFEAMTECYIPLLGVLNRLQHERVRYRLTLSLSPTLITMWRDELLQQRYLRYLHNLIELSDKEIRRTRHDLAHQALARLYRRYYQHTLTLYREQYECDLLNAFLSHQKMGQLELLTTAATHGFLPLLSASETAVRNQIDVGIDTFNQHVGFVPKGFWLPECGYYPGLERFLSDAGIEYFFTDSHSFTYARTPAKDGVYAPLRCPNGVVAFARDPESSRQVWSAQEGYPGDEDYREYYSDIGFELELDYLAPYLLADKTRVNTGIKYRRITGHECAKELYAPRKAYAKAMLHSADFIKQRQQQCERLGNETTKPPLIVAPYDAELFGHWWFEGPVWLEHVLRNAAKPDSSISTVTPSDYLTQHSDLQTSIPSASTWGEHGYFSYWINDSNDWIYPHLYQASTKMEKFVLELQGLSLTPLQERALNQAVRSILLAQASDWPFIMKSGTTKDYATKRVTDHLARFNYLYESVRSGRINERYLTALEIMDNIFPALDFRDYCSLASD